MSKGKYVLEVCEFITEKDGNNGWLSQGGKIKHIGYMKGKFKTKKDAVSYYDKHNPHMRSQTTDQKVLRVLIGRTLLRHMV